MEEVPKQKWSKLYTLVLLANILYFIIFYILTQVF